LQPYQGRRHNTYISLAQISPTKVKQILAAYDLCRLGFEELEGSKPI
jgi:hypothetical protein